MILPLTLQFMQLINALWTTKRPQMCTDPLDEHEQRTRAWP